MIIGGEISAKDTSYGPPMFFNPSSIGVSTGRKALQIRPAVPLIYERRVPTATAHQLSGKPPTSETDTGIPVKDDGNLYEKDHLVQEPAQELDSRIDDGQSPQTRYGSEEGLESHIGVLSQKPQEVEQRSEVSGLLSRGDQEEAEEESLNEAEDVSKDVDEELLTVSLGPPSSIESISEGNSITYDPEKYPGPYAQLPDAAGNIAQAPAFPNGWTVPAYGPQVQSHFTQGWIADHEMSRIGGLAPPTPSASVDDAGTSIDPKFVDHVLSSFNDDSYADIRLTVTHDKSQFDDTTFYLHRVLVFRSKTVRNIPVTSKAKDDGTNINNELRISLRDRFVNVNALESALRTCYGQPASTFFISKDHDESESHSDQSVPDMQNVIAYAAAGHLFQLGDVALQALEKARKVLGWENLENAISFGLVSSLHCRGSAEADLLQPFAYSKRDGDCFSIDCARYLLELSLDFIIACFPDTWVFNRAAKALPMVDRLPGTFKGSVSRAKKSGLLRIQFGQRLPEAPSHLTDRNALISSILLSIPMEQLRIITSAKIPSVIRHMPQIIEEREHRRLAVLNSDVPWELRKLSEEGCWFWVGFKEFLVGNDFDDGQLNLSCSRVSIYRNSAEEKKAESQDEEIQDQAQDLDASDP